MTTRVETFTHVINLQKLINDYVNGLTIERKDIVFQSQPVTFVDQVKGMLIVHITCEIENGVSK